LLSLQGVHRVRIAMTGSQRWRLPVLQPRSGGIKRNASNQS
jgi:hypothetical protein